MANMRTVAWVMFLFCSVMFVYQTTGTINDLRNPDIVEAVEMVQLSGFEKPLITACVKTPYDLYTRDLTTYNADNTTYNETRHNEKVHVIS